MFQLNLIKEIKKDYKKYCKRYQNLSKREKEETATRLRILKKSLIRSKTKDFECRKIILQ